MFNNFLFVVIFLVVLILLLLSEMLALIPLFFRETLQFKGTRTTPGIVLTKASISGI